MSASEVQISLHNLNLRSLNEELKSDGTRSKEDHDLEKKENKRKITVAVFVVLLILISTLGCFIHKNLKNDGANFESISGSITDYSESYEVKTSTEKYFSQSNEDNEHEYYDESTELKLSAPLITTTITTTHIYDPSILLTNDADDDENEDYTGQDAIDYSKFCKQLFKIEMSKNRTKIVCFVSIKDVYEEAENICTSRWMSPLNVTNAIREKSLEFSKKIYQLYKVTSIWIANPKPRRSFCLAVRKEGQNNLFKVYHENCKEKLNIFCEFNVK